MKLTVSNALMLIVLATSAVAQAQMTPDSTITDLQRQIQAREAIERDSRTSADLRTLNHRVLDEKRAQLRAVVQSRIGQLQNYLQALGTSATAEERQYAETTLRYLMAISGGVPASPVPAPMGTQPTDSMRPRIAGEPQASASVRLTTTSNQTASSIRFEPVREGDSTIRGWSPSSVNEILVEVRTRKSEVRNSSDLAYSHAQGQPISPIIYRVMRFGGNAAGAAWEFTVKLPHPLNRDQEVRAIPNGNTDVATSWVGVSNNGMGLDSRDGNPVQDSRIAQPVRTTMSANAALPAAAPTQTGFRINGPDTTSLEKIEIEVELSQITHFGARFKVAVTNAGAAVGSESAIIIGGGDDAGSTVVTLKPGVNKITVTAADNPARVKYKYVTYTPIAAPPVVAGGGGRGGAGGAPPPPAPPGESGAGDTAGGEKTPYTRAIVGLEQAAASSANPTQKLFLEFNLNVPVFRRMKQDQNGNDILETAVHAPLWLWLNPRITSLPQQVSSSVAEFSTGSNFFSPITGGKVNEIVQAFEFLGGLEIPLRINRNTVSAPFDSGFGDDTKVRFGLSGIVGVGAITPFSSNKVPIQVFKVNDTVINRFPNAKGKDYIAFVSGDRSRFFRQYYAGLRLKSYFMKGTTEDLAPIFPGVIDFTIGQNEAITGGALRGMVVRIDGVYPLPFFSGDKKGSIYAFGSVMMKLAENKNISPVILQLPDSGANVTVPGANVDLETTPIEDRDHYRIGVGVDLIKLLKGGKPKPSGSSETADPKKPDE